MSIAMTDIHCHMLFGVDDGPADMDESQRMMKAAKQQGIERVILTPHYRRGMFPYQKGKILENYALLFRDALALGLQLSLGCEYHMDGDCIANLSSGRCLTLAGSEYVLAEYSGVADFSYIWTTAQELLSHGYRPVIAHAERCRCFTDHPDYVYQMRRAGALIQVNADAVLGNDGHAARKFCKKLLKKEDVDIVASDSHGIHSRVCRMRECRDYVEKKYGIRLAKLLFEENPGKIG